MEVYKDGRDEWEIGKVMGITSLPCGMHKVHCRQKNLPAIMFHPQYHPGL